MQLFLKLNHGLKTCSKQFAVNFLYYGIKQVLKLNIIYIQLVLIWNYTKFAGKICHNMAETIVIVAHGVTKWNIMPLDEFERS